MKFFISTLIVLSSLFTFAGTTQTLDGKTFKGEVMEKGKTEKNADDFVFEGGKFTSTECTQYGFNATAYKVMTAGSDIKWTATATNENGAKMSWVGTIKGDHLEAKATWTQKGEKSKEMVYTGTLTSLKK